MPTPYEKPKAIVQKVTPYKLPKQILRLQPTPYPKLEPHKIPKITPKIQLYPTPSKIPAPKIMITYPTPPKIPIPTPPPTKIIMPLKFPKFKLKIKEAKRKPIKAKRPYRPTPTLPAIEWKIVGKGIGEVTGFEFIRPIPIKEKKGAKLRKSPMLKAMTGVAKAPRKMPKLIEGAPRRGSLLGPPKKTKKKKKRARKFNILGKSKLKGGLRKIV
jgi:hypothetical protein